MFGFLKQKKATPPAQTAPTGLDMSYGQLQTPKAPSSPDGIDVIFLSECFARALHGLKQNGVFQGLSPVIRASSA